MKSFTTKNKLTYFLTLAAIALWGVIILNVVNYFKEVHNDKSTIVEKPTNYDNKILPTKFSQVDIDTLSFVELNKNPFEFGNIVLPVSKPVMKKIVPLLPIINFKISGVIINGDKKLAILNDLTNNQTVFLSEGKVYKNILIKSIDVEAVTVIENNQQKVLVLKR